MNTPNPSGNAPGLRTLLDEALTYWEPRRIVYNLVLAAVVLGWLIGTWPHLRPALTLQALLLLFVLGTAANVCYCAAYFVDLPLQYSSFRSRWLKWRFGLWLAGMLLATVLANYWIADEIYPYVLAAG
jgi:hypothetical protein